MNKIDFATLWWNLCFTAFRNMYIINFKQLVRKIYFFESTKKILNIVRNCHGKCFCILRIFSRTVNSSPPIYSNKYLDKFHKLYIDIFDIQNIRWTWLTSNVNMKAIISNNKISSYSPSSIFVKWKSVYIMLTNKRNLQRCLKWKAHWKEPARPTFSVSDRLGAALALVNMSSVHPISFDSGKVIP